MKTILLIDDDELVRFSIRFVLERAGYRVIEADNGRKGLAAFDDETPDLVITDILMPEMDGMEVLTEITLNKAPQVPILAISGGGKLDADSYIETARGLGAASVLAKPFGNDDLLSMVQSLLKA